MAKNDYVPVTADDWYQRRREDAEGEFFRKVADQGPRKGQGGATRQGIYCFTADGKLLAYKNAGQDPDVMRDVLKQGLAAYRKLPETQRKPGAVQVDDPKKVDERFDRSPPPGGLVVRVYTRILDKDDQGEYCPGKCNVRGGDKSARDHLWLTEAEWKKLVPANPRPGAQVLVPAAVAERIARFHLNDNTRGEPNMWQRQEIRSLKLTLTVTAATADEVRLKLEGAVLLATDAATRGFDAGLLGYIHYDARTKAITRFDVVAVGDHWGEGTYTRRARPGKNPLGVAFELARGDTPADKVPPQAAREVNGYFGTGR